MFFIVMQGVSWDRVKVWLRGLEYVSNEVSVSVLAVPEHPEASEPKATAYTLVPAL